MKGKITSMVKINSRVVMFQHGVSREWIIVSTYLSGKMKDMKPGDFCHIELTHKVGYFEVCELRSIRRYYLNRKYLSLVECFVNLHKIPVKKWIMKLALSKYM